MQPGCIQRGCWEVLHCTNTGGTLPLFDPLWAVNLLKEVANLHTIARSWANSISVLGFGICQAASKTCANLCLILCIVFFLFVLLVTTCLACQLNCPVPAFRCLIRTFSVVKLLRPLFCCDCLLHPRFLLSLFIILVLYVMLPCG